MEVDKVPLDQKDEAIRNLANLITFAHKENDDCAMELGMSSYEFQYGNLYTDFIYANWGQFCQKEAFKNISQASLQLLTSSCCQKPSLGKEISLESFEQNKQPLSKAGLSIPSILKIQPYVCTKVTWKKFKIDYFRSNQSEIDWEVADNNFLPFKHFSDLILLEEIDKHDKNTELENEFTKLLKESPGVTDEKDKMLIRSNAIANTFHDQVMKKMNERQLIAYTKEIGGKICLANSYVFDAELSKNEQNEVHKPRYIYIILNRENEFQYISLDIRHGMFEYHNKFGDHLGEYRFNSTLNSPAEINHSLKTL